MNKEIKALVALEDGIAPQQLDEVLPPGDGIEVLDYLRGLATNYEQIRDKKADLFIVACSPGALGVTALIEHAVSERPDRPVVVFQLGAAESNGFMQQVFGAGADDIVTLPESAEHVRNVLQKAMARRRGANQAQGSEPAPLVTVLGPKGGTGKTVTACNLAVAMAAKGRTTVLVDLDLSFGDVGLGLRLSPDRTVYDLARAGGTLDAEKADDYLVEHSSGVRALLAPTRPDHAGAVRPEFVKEVLDVLRATNGIVIVDTPASFPPEVITAVDNSTGVCMVGMLDAFSLKDTKLGLETLDRMGYDRQSVRVVLNRADSHVGISSDDVAAVLGRKPDVLIPSQRDIPRSLTDGEPIVSKHPHSSAAKAFRALAQLYMQPRAAGKPQAAPVTASGAEPRRRRALLKRA